MPQIKGYSQQTDIARPRDTRRASADDFGFGKAVSKFGDDALSATETVNRRIEQDEISEASVKLSEAHAQFGNLLDEEVQKGTIDSEQIAQKYDEHIAKLSENISTRGGQQFFERSSANLRANLVQSAFAGQSEIAGTKARVNYEKTLDNYSVGLQKDPSSLEVASATHDEFISSLVAGGSLKAKDAEVLRYTGKQKLTVQSIRGWMDLNPEGTLKELKSGKWDTGLSPELKRQLEGEIDSNIRARRLEDERLKQAAERAKKARQLEIQNTFLEKMEKGELSAKDVLDSGLEPFGSGSKKQFLDMMEKEQNEPIKTNTDTYTNLFERIHLPDGDPNKITDENELNKFVVQQKLSFTDLKQLRAEMQGKGTAAGQNVSMLKKQLMAAAKSKLVRANPMLNIKDPEGEQNYSRFLNTILIEEYQKQRKLGKSDLQLFSPESPDYLGQYIGNYTKTPSQILKDQIKSTRQQIPVALPDGTVPGIRERKIRERKEGESPADFLKSIKAGQ